MLLSRLQSWSQAIGVAEPPPPRLILPKDFSSSWHYPYWQDLFKERQNSLEKGPQGRCWWDSSRSKPQPERSSFCQQDRLDYTMPKTGDYHDRALKQRLGLLQDLADKEALAAKDNWVVAYVDALKGAGSKGGELVVSRIGRNQTCA